MDAQADLSFAGRTSFSCSLESRAVGHGVREYRTVVPFNPAA